MRSFFKAASVVALTTLGLLQLTSAQEISDAFVNTVKDGGFKDSMNPLKTLTVGPYPRLGDQAVVTSGTVSPNPAAMGLVANLGKRGAYCDPGYGFCGNGCCQIGYNCFADINGCCPPEYNYMCGGGKYCCPYNSCLSNGHCGCNNNLYRCGDWCCQYGCTSAGTCACNPSYPVDCGSIGT
ncbi:hypothetical protein BGZ83_003950, partial [Gryganskiella cystojenkinii]